MYEEKLEEKDNQINILMKKMEIFEALQLDKNENALKIEMLIEKGILDEHGDLFED